MRKAFVQGAICLLLLGAAGCRQQVNERQPSEQSRQESVVEDVVEEAPPAFDSPHAHRELPFGTKLASSTSELDLEPGLPMVVVGPESVMLDGKAVISLSNGAIPPNELYGGEGGFVVTRLLEAIKRRGDEIAAGPGQPPGGRRYEKITIAVDGRTTSDVLHKVLDSARGGGFYQYQLLVSNSAGEHRALRTCTRRCCRQPSPPCWGVPQAPPVDILRGGELVGDLDEVMRAVKGPSKVPTKAPSDTPSKAPRSDAPEEERDDPLNLVVSLAESGIRLNATGARLPEECSNRNASIGVRQPPTLPRRADGTFDFASLERCLVRVHRAHPEEPEVIVSTSSSIDWATTVRVIDLARGGKARPMFPRFLLVTGLE